MRLSLKVSVAEATALHALEAESLGPRHEA